MSRIFISHSSDDREQSARLLAWLHNQGFVSTFLDFDKHRGIEAGANWERTLYRELSSADAVILVLTRNWFDSKWCFVEYAQARALGKAIYPLIESPAGETFVSSDIQHLDLTRDREGGLERLLSELTRITLSSRGDYAWDRTRPPYPGLLAFDEADAAIYFGRDDDIRRLIERLNARRAQGGEKLLVVLGASGSGKSSLLRAGAVPRIKRDPHNWIVLPPFRPQLHPLDELAQVLAIGLGQPTLWRQWRDTLSESDLSDFFSDLARDIRAAHKQTEAHILLVIDQGEELFTGSDPHQTEQFFRVLNGLLDQRLPFLAITSLRSDFLGRLQQEPLFEAPFEQFSLKPMPLERVRDIIEGPARVAGITVDNALVTAAVADARTDDALPLLAFALRELCDRFASSGHFTAEAYRALGDPQLQLSPLENAVRRKADEVLAAANPSTEDLENLKQAFIPAMVRVNLEGEYVRRPAPFAAIAPRALFLIERLAKARLLTIHEERGISTVEVAHEALLRKWPLLNSWLDEEREFLVGKNQLEQDLIDWEGARPEQKTDALLAGLKLIRARTWLLAKSQQLTAPEREFIQTSIARNEAAAARRERARRRILYSAVAAAVVLSFVAAAAFWQQELAVSRQLAAQSMFDASTDLGGAFREAEAAGERVHTAEANHALDTALGNPRERFIFHHKSWLTSAVFSPDGRRIVTGSYDNTARVWDAWNGRLLLTLVGHTKGVEQAAFSPDGGRIITASDDNTARVWDAGNGQLLVTLLGHTNLVSSVAFSPDGEVIVTASKDKTARLWDAGTGRMLAVLTGHTDVVLSAVFSPNGKRIITASQDHTARVWNAETGRLLLTLAGHNGTVVGASFSPDSSRIVTASDDHTARIWDARNGKLIVTLTGHSDQVYSAVFSPDGSRIATASFDATARVWDARIGRLLATFTGHSLGVVSVAFSPDGRRIVTASEDHTARVWDAMSGGLLATLTGHSSQVDSAAFSPDGTHIVTSSEDNTARVWDSQDGRMLAALLGHTNAVFSATFSPDGSRIVTASWDHTARVWDAGNGRLLATLSGHADQVLYARFSPDGNSIVTASKDHSARVWDAWSGRLLATLIGHTDQVVSARFSPDGGRIVTSSVDHTARVWDARDGHLLVTLTGHTDWVRGAAFSPDGNCIVTASGDNTARIWDAKDGMLLATLTGHADKVFSAVFSPDSNRVVTASGDNTARIWDAGSGRLLHTLAGHTSWVFFASFSPDGKTIVTASADNTARIWDAGSARLLYTLARHTGPVWDAFFSPDGKCIVTASVDHTARVWNAKDGRLQATLTGHTDMVFSAVFSPDSNRVVTASQDGTANIYIVDFEELLARAKQLLPVDSGN